MAVRIEGDRTADERVPMVDPRQPRFGQAVTGVVLAVGYLLDWPVVLPIVGAVLAGASLLGPRGNLYAHLYRGLRRLAGLRAPGRARGGRPPAVRQHARATGYHPLP
jgi:hypothetical protein